MTLRRIATIPGTDDNRQVRVIYSTEWAEYIARIYNRHADGNWYPDRNSDYHTDDREDAVETARLMVRS